MIYALAALNLAALVLVGYVIRGWRQDHVDVLGRLDGREDAHRAHIAALHLSHREEIAALNQARIEETANLLQRIQAPEQAVVSHAAEAAPLDPPPANLENDQEMFELYEERMRNLGVLDG